MKAKTTLILTLIFFQFAVLKGTSQNILKPKKGYSPQIGAVVSMLEDLKRRVTNTVQDLTIEETDFLLDEKANRIGAMILHLAAIETYYQVHSFENRGFTRAEQKKWGIAVDLTQKTRDSIINKPISYYLNIWNEVRAKTLKLLKTKDDKWFKSKIKVKGMKMNNHWIWYHVMEHQANHMGQIRLIKKRARK